MIRKIFVSFIVIFSLTFLTTNNALSQNTTEEIIIYGTTMPFKKATISSKVSGIIEYLPEIEGIKVKSGEVIIKIDKKDFELNYNVILKQLKSAEISKNYAELEYKRTLELYNKNSISTQQKDKATSNFELSVATYELTKANLKIAEKTISDSIIYAPFDGIITKKFYNENEFLDKGKPVLEIINLDTIKIYFKVPEKYLNYVKVGNKIKVIIEHCLKQEFIGEICSINPLGDITTHSFDVIVNVLNHDHIIKAGMFAKGILEINQWFINIELFCEGFYLNLYV